MNCPFCNNEIRNGAQKCKHCKKYIVDDIIYNNDYKNIVPDAHRPDFEENRTLTIIHLGTNSPPKNKTCPFCSESVLYTAKKCKHCGEFFGDNIMSRVSVKNGALPKNRGMYIILGLLAGMLGIHNFYAGYDRRGFAQLVLSAISLLFSFLFIPIFFLIPVAFSVLFDIILVEKDANGETMV